MKVKKTSTSLEVLLHIAKGPVWDGDLISNDITKRLHIKDLVCRAYGFNFISEKGVDLLTSLDLMVP